MAGLLPAASLGLAAALLLRAREAFSRFGFVVWGNSLVELALSWRKALKQDDQGEEESVRGCSIIAMEKSFREGDLKLDMARMRGIIFSDKAWFGLYYYTKSAFPSGLATEDGGVWKDGIDGVPSPLTFFKEACKVGYVNPHPNPHPNAHPNPNLNLTLILTLTLTLTRTRTRTLSTNPVPYIEATWCSNRLKIRSVSKGATEVLVAFESHQLSGIPDEDLLMGGVADLMKDVDQGNELHQIYRLLTTESVLLWYGTPCLFSMLSQEWRLCEHLHE